MGNFANYAHRGASHYAPENTMMAFYMGMHMGANGIETDVQLTADGVPVLFHDDTLMRVTGEAGSVSDYTLEKLSTFLVKKDGIADKIPTFEDFLQHFAFRDITFAIELKQTGTVPQVAEMIRRYGVEEKVVITSFIYDEVCEMRRFAPELKTGCLTDQVTEELLLDMKERGICELCPKAELLTAEKVALWHSLSFNVRAWGVADEKLMKYAFDCGVDGMTVNFPDKLTAYIKEKRNV